MLLRFHLRLLAFLSLLFLAPFVATSEDGAPDYSEVGTRISGELVDGVAVTEGVIRVRRRHENDMDFGKYNPFYWEGRRAQFRLEDHTAAGESKLVFTLETEWPQDHTRDRGSDLSLIYIGDPLAHETERSKFVLNTRMEVVGDGFTKFTKTIEKGAFDAFPEQLADGALLVFEFRFFNNEEHPGWAKQKERNGHNLSAYYSEFFRVEIGKPGLLIDDLDTPNAFPSPLRYAGGWTTTPTARVEPWTALQQAATNLRYRDSWDFLLGRTWFHTDLQTGEHVGDTNDDKPSRFFPETEEGRKGHAGLSFNASSCNSCHTFNAGALLPAVGEPVHTTVFRFTHGTPSYERFGKQVQTAGPEREAEVLLARYDTKEVALADGTVVELSKPVFSVDGATDLPLSVRRPPSLIGMGLLDAIPQRSITALAQQTGGTPSLVYKGTLARFGWKAEAPSLDYQILDALRNDMGWDEEVSDKTNVNVDAIRAYVALLGVPPRRRPEHPDVVAGEKIFHETGCAICHVPTHRTSENYEFKELANQTIHPYTDLLLHYMGPGLSDVGDGRHAGLWRTAPLWGLKNTRDAARDHREQFPPGNTEVTYEMTLAAAQENPVQLLHDGRARSLAEAILWHGGEAEFAAEAYRKLSAEDRAALEAFVWDL